jgi:hypothetical protein
VITSTQSQRLLFNECRDAFTKIAAAQSARSRA